MVKFIEKILGIKEHGDSPRADLMLPNSILFLGIVIFFIGIVIGVVSLFDFNSNLLLAALLVILFGAMSVIWWRNTTITITSSETFEVKSMFGKVKTFNFKDITGYDKSYNYIDVYVGKDKFKVESTSLMTQRFRTLLNKALNKEVFK